MVWGSGVGNSPLEEPTPKTRTANNQCHKRGEALHTHYLCEKPILAFHALYPENGN